MAEEAATSQEEAEETTAEEASAAQEEAAETTAEEASAAQEEVAEATAEETATAREETAEASEEAAAAQEDTAEGEGKEAALEEAGDVVDSGTCGENSVWTLTGAEPDLTLTISGSGDMSEFSPDSIPWRSKDSMIKTVIVEDGITGIGDCAFY